MIDSLSDLHIKLPSDAPSGPLAANIYLINYEFILSKQDDYVRIIAHFSFIRH